MENTQTDCKEVLKLLYQYLDGELEESQAAGIAAHFEVCADCFRRMGVERDFKQLIATRCKEGRAPESVLSKIRAAIRAASS